MTAKPSSIRIIPKPPTKKVSKRYELREQIWPNVTEELWDRKKEVGFCTIPRTLPLVMTLIDLLSEKGKDASRIYFDL